MRAGMMRDRVQFQRLAAVTDDYGNVTDGSFATYLTVWGQLSERPQGERFEAGRLQSEVPAVLRVRKSTDTDAVRVDDRAVIGGTAYQITAITNPARKNAVLEMHIERGVGT